MVRRNYVSIPELNYSWESIDLPTYDEKYQIVEANGVKNKHDIMRIATEAIDLRKVYQSVIEYGYDSNLNKKKS